MKRPAASLLLLSIASCSPASRQDTLEPPAAPIPSPQSSTSPAPAPSADQAPDPAEAQVHAMLQVVSRLRELPVRGPVRSATIDRPTMLSQLRQNVHDEIPAEVVRGQGEFLRAFGFLPPGFDFEAGLYRLMESQLAGYYDPDRKAMFLMDDLSASEADATLAHELVHALQDQHYDLAPRLKYHPDANDAQSAVQSLAEGDATSAMLDYVLAKQDRDALSIPDSLIDAQIAAGIALSPALASSPSILRNSLVSPYLDGVQLVHALRRRGGWAAVDAVWKNPPATTEQLLHIEKLDAREPAESVATPPLQALGSGWRETYRDVYGEQGVRLAFEEWMPRRAAAKAAAGWAGDRAVLAVDPSGKRLAAAWRIRFDACRPPLATNAEASEAFGAITSAWNVAAATRRESCQVLADGAARLVAIQDRDVLLVALPAWKPDHSEPSGCAAGKLWAHAILSSP